MANLITAANAVTYTELPASFDTNKISTHIDVAERRHIRKQVCVTYYDTLVTENVAGSLTAANTIIYDKIKYAAAYFVLFEALPFMRNQIGNLGLMNYNFDGGDQTEFRDFQALRDAIKNRAEYWLHDAIEYMEDSDNSSNYSTYNECDGDELDINRKTNNTGIVFLRKEKVKEISIYDTQTQP